jgi:hypothetical protein
MPKGWRVRPFGGVFEYSAAHHGHRWSDSFYRTGRPNSSSDSADWRSTAKSVTLRTFTGLARTASRADAHFITRKIDVTDIKGDRLYVKLGASQTRRLLKGFGHGVRKVESAGRHRAVIIHTATGRHLEELRLLLADVLTDNSKTQSDAIESKTD